MSKFAIIKTGGKQYKVREGDVLKVEKLAAAKKVEFVDILNGQKVIASILGNKKDTKVRILKFRAKKRYKRVKGHRQQYSQIKIEKIQ
jgi:large subunit ribosomal protein L21